MKIFLDYTQMAVGWGAAAAVSPVYTIQHVVNPVVKPV